MDIRDRTKQLLQKLINFNNSKEREYYEISLDIQRNYGIDDYVDLHSHFMNSCDAITNNINIINELSGDELVVVEQMLLNTVQYISINASANLSVPTMDLFGLQRRWQDGIARVRERREEIIDNFWEISFTEWQRRINLLEEKARTGKDFTRRETLFIRATYRAIAAGGVTRGFFEASQLISIYTTPILARLYTVERPVRINSVVYVTSVIVQFAMKELKKIIKTDINNEKLKYQYNSRILPPTPGRDVNALGRILDDGRLIAEQNNLRLKYADNRFYLYVDVLERSNNIMKLRWYVTNRYDFAPYPNTNYSRFPFRGQVLLIDDGFSHYLTEVGLAKEFHYLGEWHETLVF